MFIHKFSFKKGMSLFAHRFSFKFKAYLIKGSSVFLKLEEPLKDLQKEESEFFLRKTHKEYKKEGFFNMALMIDGLIKFSLKSLVENKIELFERTLTRTELESFKKNMKVDEFNKKKLVDASGFIREIFVKYDDKLLEKTFRVADLDIDDLYLYGFKSTDIDVAKAYILHNHNDSRRIVNETFPYHLMGDGYGRDINIQEGMIIDSSNNFKFGINEISRSLGKANYTNIIKELTFGLGNADFISIISESNKHLGKSNYVNIDKNNLIGLSKNDNPKINKESLKVLGKFDKIKITNMVNTISNLTRDNLKGLLINKGVRNIKKAKIIELDIVMSQKSLDTLDINIDVPSKKFSLTSMKQYNMRKDDSKTSIRKIDIKDFFNNFKNKFIKKPKAVEVTKNINENKSLLHSKAYNIGSTSITFDINRINISDLSIKPNKNALTKDINVVIQDIINKYPISKDSDVKNIDKSERKRKFVEKSNVIKVSKEGIEFVDKFNKIDIDRDERLSSFLQNITIPDGLLRNEMIMLKPIKLASGGHLETANYLTAESLFGGSNIYTNAFYEKVNKNELTFENKIRLHSKVHDTDLSKEDFNHFLVPLKVSKVWRQDDALYLKNVQLKDIFTGKNPFLKMYSNKESFLTHAYRAYDRVSLKDGSKPKEMKFIDKSPLMIFSENKPSFLTDVSLVDIFAINSKGLTDVQLVDIVLDKNKSINKVNFTDITKDKILSMKSFGNTGIIKQRDKGILRNISTRKISEFQRRKNSIQFLKLHKRWWFLKATKPTDKVNIPNIDYPYESKAVLGMEAHPIPEFTNQGTKEIEVSMEIMIELVNIVMQWWHYSYNEAFRGMGDEVLQGMMRVLYNWYNLETSQEQILEKGSDEHYKRVFRWIRWEVEKVFFLYKKDVENNKIYHGNYYMNILTKNLLEYVEDHHYMVVPMYKSLKRMSIMRGILNDDPQSDIMTSLPNKMKGERNYIIDEEDDNYSL